MRTGTPTAVMPFGKHKGRPLAEVPADYLRWLLENVRVGPGFRREVAEDLDRREREAARAAEEASAPLPTAPPRWVGGVWLGPIEAGLFEEARRAGELVVGPDLPASSGLPAAWAAFCLADGVPHRVRELSLADVGAAPSGGDAVKTPRDPERFLLLLRDADAGEPDAPPAAIRLKRALKVLLRSFGLRCERAEIHPAPPAGPLPDALGGGEVDQG